MEGGCSGVGSVALLPVIASYVMENYVGSLALIRMRSYSGFSCRSAILPLSTI
jgi:hypothetical protein